MLGLLLSVLSCDRNSSNEPMELSQVQKSSNTTFARTANIMSLYDEIVALDDTTEQLIVASALSPEEIYQLWLTKIDDYKENNEVNAEQLTFLTNLENSFSPEVFQEGEIRDAFDFNGKLLEAQDIFGENEGWYLLNRVENINHRVSRILETSEVQGNPIEACECNKNSNCRRITGVSWVGSFLGVWNMPNRRML